LVWSSALIPQLEVRPELTKQQKLRKTYSTRTATSYILRSTEQQKKGTKKVTSDAEPNLTHFSSRVGLCFGEQPKERRRRRRRRRRTTTLTSTRSGQEQH